MLGIDVFGEIFLWDIDMFQYFFGFVQFVDGNIDIYVIFVFVRYLEFCFGMINKSSCFIEGQYKFRRFCLVVVGMMGDRSFVGLR